MINGYADILKGKRIIFLGSSVTYGAASGGISFADYIAEQCGCDSIKEAVSGTTLVDNGPDSYVSRYKNLKVEGQVDLFICQLSTNDATRNLPVGTVTDSFLTSGFDTNTSSGAMEYIIAYTKERYGCPVMFYTGPKYDSAVYGEMVDALQKISKKWNFDLIDLWNDMDFNDISDTQRVAYMADPIHPTAIGYREWWTPYFIEKIAMMLTKEN